MLERLETIAKEVEKNTSSTIMVRKMRKQVSYCIKAEVIGVAGVSPDEAHAILFFGQCTKDPIKWHVFLASRAEPKDHPLDYLKPSVSNIEKGMRVATFTPTEITDEVLREVVKKMVEANALAFYFGL